MLTHQEKAKEIYDYYLTIVQKIDKVSYLTRVEEEYFTRTLSINKCNEILGYMGADRGYEFWTNVLYELEHYGDI